MSVYYNRTIRNQTLIPQLKSQGYKKTKYDDIEHHHFGV